MSKKSKSAKSVVITGASAGIGRALALEFAARGYDLGLTARRLNVLQEVREQIHAAPETRACRVELATVDVSQPQSVAQGLQGLFAALGGADIVVVNAGINAITKVGRGDLDMELQIIQTNLVGAIATVSAAVEHFLPRGGGQIVGISSLASLQGMPKQAAYCASKAGFSIYLDSVRTELRHKNITVTNILPGFVKTDIVADIDKFPFVIPAEQAAREIVAHIEKKVRLGIVPAFPWKFLRPVFGHVPDAIWSRIS